MKILFICQEICDTFRQWRTANLFVPYENFNKGDKNFRGSDKEKINENEKATLNMMSKQQDQMRMLGDNLTKEQLMYQNEINMQKVNIYLTKKHKNGKGNQGLSKA